MNTQLTSYRDEKSICLVCKELQDVGTPYLYRDMVIASQLLDCTYSGAFLDTINFLQARARRVPIQTVRIIHYLVNDDNCGYSQRQVDAIVQLLSAIPENSLTHLECVYFKS